MEKRDEFSAEILSAEHLALCPLDGRYAKVGRKLSPYFSEYALVKNRVKVEVYWLRFLLEAVNGSEILDAFDVSKIPEILSIYEEFSDQSFVKVKKIEAETKHDVKAVELFVADELVRMGMRELVSFVHFGCTSEDITNPAYSHMISSALEEVWIPAAEKLIDCISEIVIDHMDTPMLAHTHGQPATPTTVGKEMMVFVYRMRESLKNLMAIKTKAKFNGATGNYAAISVAFPNEDWQIMSRLFVEECLGLEFNPITTQIESHDYICHIADAMRHFNNVLMDFNSDMWLYIGKEYFKQLAVKNEVGSSTMPHKVNPINFENSASNIDTSNALLMALSNKLPRSRMQRDLSDSSSQRNIGIAIGYSLQAVEQAIIGVKRVAVNVEKIAADLDSKWEVLAEPIQTMLRKYGIPDAYDRLKELTRGKHISKKAIRKFIESLDMLSDEDRNTLLTLTPSTYIGLASKIVDDNF